MYGIICCPKCRFVTAVDLKFKTKKWCKTTTRGNWDKRNIDAYDGLVMSLFEKKA